METGCTQNSGHIYIEEYTGVGCMYMHVRATVSKAIASYEGETNCHSRQEIFVGIAARLTVLEEEICGSLVDC